MHPPFPRAPLLPPPFLASTLSTVFPTHESLHWTRAVGCTARTSAAPSSSPAATSSIARWLALNGGSERAQDPQRSGASS
ncbi:unnamed protein product [Victoria cruziana]